MLTQKQKSNVIVDPLCPFHHDVAVSAYIRWLSNLENGDYSHRVLDIVNDSVPHEDWKNSTENLTAEAKEHLRVYLAQEDIFNILYSELSLSDMYSLVNAFKRGVAGLDINDYPAIVALNVLYGIEGHNDSFVLYPTCSTADPVLFYKAQLSIKTLSKYWVVENLQEGNLSGKDLDFLGLGSTVLEQFSNQELLHFSGVGSLAIWREMGNRRMSCSLNATTRQKEEWAKHYVSTFVNLESMAGKYYDTYLGTLRGSCKDNIVVTTYVKFHCRYTQGTVSIWYNNWSYECDKVLYDLHTNMIATASSIEEAVDQHTRSGIFLD